MSALERARERWAAADVIDQREPVRLAELLDGLAERLDDLLRPGWWVCPSCGRQSDREGTRGTARRWCLGSLRGYASHPPVEMEIRR